MTLIRYLRLLGVQLRASALMAMQYRVDFALDGLIEIFWGFTAIIPLFVVYSARESVAGWNFGESLLVVGWFTLLTGVLEGAVSPALTTVVEHIRKGTLDFVLIKPADAQFLVCTARLLPWRAVNVVTALVVFGYAFRLLGRTPTFGAIAMSLALLWASTAVLFSLGILTVSAAFYVVRIDNLMHLFISIFDAARWPSAVFRGAIRFIFTFVIPLALMTTYPAQALLGTLPVSTFVLSLLGAAIFVGLSRLVWLRALGKYTSAS
ncbi:ABC-2 family transporter protein [Pendulispora brunnea]|uniref:ABC-2 family transporter protein n=1 Tax=Pendulispora brunnea TaxID=2905690 RepID=A0ABZ2KCS5_9BACT